MIAPLGPSLRATQVGDSRPSCPRRVDQARAAAAVRELLLAIGEDPDREGLMDTPARVARMYQELCSGLYEDASVHLGRSFTEHYDEVVVLRDIEFASICEHHLLPFKGRAHVAYRPGERVVGLSKLARVVHTYARRPQIQERLTGQVADALMDHGGATAALVVMEAEHMCMKIRGVNDACSSMVTSAARGDFRQDPNAKREALELISINR